MSEQIDDMARVHERVTFMFDSINDVMSKQDLKALVGEFFYLSCVAVGPESGRLYRDLMGFRAGPPKRFRNVVIIYFIPLLLVYRE